MRYFSRAILPGVLGFAVAVLVAACGSSSGLFSSGQATNLDDQLNTIANAIDAGQCNSASAAAQNFNSSVANLSGVDTRLTNNLKQASQKLAQQAASDCSNQETASTPAKTKTKTVTTPTTSTATTTTTPSTPTSTTTTTVTPPPTTTSETTSTSPGTTNTSGGAGLPGTPTTDTGTGTGPAGTGGVPTGAAGGDGNAQ